jgi:RNA polymerase sigma-70 factor (ECF subfamily)
MLRLRGGDRGALAPLIERNSAKVHALVLRFLNDPSMVDDLTQEVFLRVYRTAARYQPAAKFSTWLYRVTANLCFNVMRDRRKAQVWRLDGDDDESRRDLPDRRHTPPHERMDAAELNERLAQAVSELPENQRIAIILNKYEDKGYQEIAEVLDLSTMAVKSLLSRARENLRASLQKYVRKGQ